MVNMNVKETTQWQSHNTNTVKVLGSHKNDEVAMHPHPHNDFDDPHWDKQAMHTQTHTDKIAGAAGVTDHFCLAVSYEHLGLVVPLSLFNPKQYDNEQEEIFISNQRGSQGSDQSFSTTSTSMLLFFWG